MRDPSREPSRKTNRRFLRCSVAVVAAALGMVLTPAFGQNLSAPVTGGKISGPVAGDFDKVHVLPIGGPSPRMADGHVDLTGRWYPNSAGRMLQVAYPVDPGAFFHFDPKVTPEPPPSFNPGVEGKYRHQSSDPGECDQAGTPTTTLEQLGQHAPMELIESPGRLVMLYEYPLDVRMVYMNREHPSDPDPTFNGDTTAHWEGDTLVLDVIAIDGRMRNSGGGGVGAWFPSEKEHVVERITRTSKNYLTYQITIEDPIVLAKPWKSAPRRWSLAQDPHDEWGEVFCTHNEEPDEYKKLKEYETKEKGK